MSGDDRIVRPVFGDPPMTVDRLEPICLHKFIVVRPRERTVWCRTCKQEIDPFEVVLDMAHNWEHATWREREMQELAARTEQLKTEEANLKARIRNARKQTDQPVEKIAEYFAEWLRRLNAAETWEELRSADEWAQRFSWLDAAMTKQINDARFRAKQRGESVQRNNTGRRRAVKVIKCGAS